MTTLGSAIEDGRLAERQTAIRALLARPVLTASGADRADYLLVRRHVDSLRTWLDLNVGWQLTVDSAVARLHKRFTVNDSNITSAVDTVGTPSSGDGTRGLRDDKGDPFTQRRYVLLCLALATLERAQFQTTLGRLADEVVAAVADERFRDAGLEFTLTTRRERSDMVAVVRLLIDLGVLTLVAGEARAFLDDSGDALYDIERRVLATLLATSIGPSTVVADNFAERFSAVLEHPSESSDDLRNRALRRNLTRRLLDDPVVYFADLSESELSYLTHQRRWLTDRISEATGLVAEIRLEGIAMVDPEDDLTDVRMPESGSQGHLTLLLAEFLATHSRVDFDAVVAHVILLIERHGAKWSQATREPGAEFELTKAALDRLERLSLILLDGHSIVPRAAISRYSSGAPVIVGRSVAENLTQPELF